MLWFFIGATVSWTAFCPNEYFRQEKCELRDCTRLGFLLFGTFGYLGRDLEVMNSGDVIEGKAAPFQEKIAVDHTPQQASSSQMFAIAMTNSRNPTTNKFLQ